MDGFIFNSGTTRGVVHALVGSGKPNLVAYPPTDRFGDGLSAEATESAERIYARSSEDSPLRTLIHRECHPSQGLHTLLDALARLPKGSVQLDIVGSLTTDPNYAAEMKKRADKINHSSIRFHGAVNNDPLVAMLKTAHVLVVPSSYEGFGIVYLEGMAFGLPAIGTTAGAAPEIIEEGRTGYLIDPDDDRALASHLAALARDRELLTRLSLNAWQRYRQQPKWEQTAASIRSFLQDQIGNYLPV